MKTRIRHEITGNRKSVSFILGAILFTLCPLLLAPCSPVQAQQPTKIPRIGFLGPAGPDEPSTVAFRRGLRDLGYVEGKNILFEGRYLEGALDRIPSLVAELVHLKVDVLVLVNTPAIRAAKQATSTIPIVMVVATDPVATGLIDSLARPGGNVTGLTRLSQELSAKRLELLREVVPTSRMGVLISADSTARGIKEYQTEVSALKVSLQFLEVRGPNPDLDGVFRDAAKRRVNALIVVGNTLLLGYRKQIADLAIKNKLPSMADANGFVEAGALMSYSADNAESFRRAAVYVDKILKGAKPAELPVEQPRKFELWINLKTAKQIGVTIPQSVLYRADKVIK
jgi:ABC-type uncharacterized transport system substrate-binding protein